jgi:hypothetical protein
MRLIDELVEDTVARMAPNWDASIASLAGLIRGRNASDNVWKAVTVGTYNVYVQNRLMVWADKQGLNADRRMFMGTATGVEIHWGARCPIIDSSFDVMMDDAGRLSAPHKTI